MFSLDVLDTRSLCSNARVPLTTQASIARSIIISMLLLLVCWYHSRKEQNIKGTPYLPFDSLLLF